MGDGGVHASQPEGFAVQRRHYGVYYAARGLETAVRETAYHFGRFAADSADAPRYESMRVLVGRIDNRFADLATVDEPVRSRLLAPDSYADSQPFGAVQRAAGRDGLVYPSVRHGGGQCVAAFRPTAVRIPVQSRHLTYHWDGTRVARYFDHELEAWVAL